MEQQGNGVYDLDAVVEALTLPQVKWRGETFEGKWPSIVQQIRFARRFSEFDASRVESDSDEDKVVEEFMELCHDFLSILGFPADDIMAAVPFQEVAIMVTDFFSQMAAQMPNDPKATLVNRAQRRFFQRSQTKG